MSNWGKSIPFAFCEQIYSIGVDPPSHLTERRGQTGRMGRGTWAQRTGRCLGLFGSYPRRDFERALIARLIPPDSQTRTGAPPCGRPSDIWPRPAYVILCDGWLAHPSFQTQLYRRAFLHHLAAAAHITTVLAILGICS